MKVSCPYLLFVLNLAACGDPGSLEGSVAGHGITLHSAIFAPYTTTLRLVSSGEAIVGPAVDAVLTDDPDACNSVKDTIVFSTAHTYLFMHLHQPYYTNQGASALPPVGPGYYSAQNLQEYDSSKQGGSALFYFKPPGCKADSATIDESPYGLNGGILVSDINASAGGMLNGDIDVKLGAHGDALKGTVHLQYCAALESLLKQDFNVDPGAWACQ